MIEFIAATLASIILPIMPINTIPSYNFNTYLNNSSATIFTPNGTPVEVQCDNETIQPEQIEYYDNYLLNPHSNLSGETIQFNEATLVDSSTTTYNNHAFAWYLYWGGTTLCSFKFNEHLTFISDKSFIQVDTPQKEDIVCYINDAGRIVHSGIIEQVYSTYTNNYLGSNLLVRSKWFQFGTYIHRGDYCPYMSQYTEIEEPASNLIYFRRHYHDFCNPVNTSDATHTLSCSCGETKEENHYYNRYTTYNQLFHLVHCKCGAYKKEKHHISIKYLNGKEIKSCVQCNESFSSNVTLSKKKENE